MTHIAKSSVGGGMQAGVGAPAAAKVGLLVLLEAKEGHEAAVEALVRKGPSVVANEPATTYWFGIKLGPRTFGIFDTFPDDAGRAAHVAGELAKELFAVAGEVLAHPPAIEKIEILATKDAWRAASTGAIRLGILARLEAKPETATTVAGALTIGLPMIDEEVGTPLWFALKLGPTTFGIFDAFVDDAARKDHVASPFAQGLLAAAAQLLSTPPTIEMVDVLGAKVRP